MNEKKIKLGKLIPSYIFIIVLTAILVLPPHLFPQPLFMPFRFPHYLEMMKPFLGISWPMSFEIYHYALYILTIIGSLNVLGIIFYPRLKKITIPSSFAGIFLFSLMILFFFFKFITVNAPTAIIYGLYSVTLLIVDLLTLKVLIRE